MVIDNGVYFSITLTFLLQTVIYFPDTNSMKLQFRGFDYCDFKMIVSETSQSQLGSIVNWMKEVRSSNYLQPWLINSLSTPTKKMSTDRLLNKCVVHFLWHPPISSSSIYQILLDQNNVSMILNDYSIVIIITEKAAKINTGMTFSENDVRPLAARLFLISDSIHGDEDSLPDSHSEEISLWMPYFWRNRGWKQFHVPEGGILRKTFLNSIWKEEYRKMEGRNVRVCYEGWPNPNILKVCLKPIYRWYNDCYGAHRVLGNIAYYFNFTIDFSVTYAYYCSYTPDVYIGVDRYVTNERDLGNFLYKHKKLTIMYCESKESFLNVSWNDWLQPFNTNVWICVIIAFITSSIVFGSVPNKKFKTQLKSIITAIFDNFCVLLRQEHRCVRKNWNILLSIVAIVLTAYYETIMTSLVIAPPDAKIFSSLKELLEAGYRIMMDDSAAGMPLDPDSIYYSYFISNNISTSNQSFLYIPTSMGFDDRVMFPTNPTYKAAFTIEDHFLGWARAEMNYENSTIRCNHVLESFAGGVKGWGFYGAFTKPMHNLISLFFQEGLMSFWYEISYWKHNIDGSKYAAKVLYDEKQPIPLNLKLKFDTIFYVWGILLGLTLVFFVLEIICFRNTKKQNWVDVAVQIVVTSADSGL